MLCSTVLSKIFVLIVYIWHIYSRNVQKYFWPIRPPPPWRRCRLVLISHNMNIFIPKLKLKHFKFFKTKTLQRPFNSKLLFCCSKITISHSKLMCNCPKLPSSCLNLSLAVQNYHAAAWNKREVVKNLPSNCLKIIGSC